jgi:polyisoprenoid-binding protein YceI
MITRPLVYAALAFALVAAPARAAEVYDIDPAHFSVVFSVSHMKMSYTYGIFRQAQARVVLDRENPAASQFQLSIKADSIDTNNAQRDNHLKSPDFFNVAQYPTIDFQSTSVVLDSRPQQGIVYQVTGNLTMHGVTRQVTLPIQLLGEGVGQDGKPKAGFLTQTELKRSDFGITTFLENDAVGDAIGITISFESARQDGAAAPPR